MANYQQSTLRSEGARHLGQAAGVASWLIYPLVALITGLASDLQSQHPDWVAMTMLATFLVGYPRWRIGRALAQAPTEKIAGLVRAYAATVYTIATCWSLFSCVVIYAYPGQWTGLLLVMVTGGITAGSTTSLTPNLRIQITYIVIMSLPQSVCMAVSGGGQQAFTGLNAMLFTLFVCKAGIANHRRYVSWLVANREVTVRNRDLRLVLDHVGQGLVTMNRDGTMSAERSRILTEWLGDAPAGQHLWDYLGIHDGHVGAQFKLGWEAILEDILPVELLLHQLPDRMTTRERDLHIEYTPIFNPNQTGAIHKLLVVISDHTAQLEREKSEADKQELMTIFDRVMGNREGFSDFIQESKQLVGSLTQTLAPLPVVKRQIHTLKGNCSLHGLGALTNLCNDIETHMSERGGGLSALDKMRLQEHWHRLSEKTDRFLDTGKSRRVELEESEIVEFRQRVTGGLARPIIVRTVTGWTLQPTRVKLDYFAAQARDLSRRLGKASLEVHLQSNNLRLPPVRWASFWASFTHMVRNAVDHGLETTAQRLKSGKSASALLTMRTFIHEQSFVIEIADDGPGIDWAAVRTKAGALGMTIENDDDLHEALFADKMSTRDEVTEFSGRGVGLGAVREACRQLQGELKISTIWGQGTTFQFLFPIQQMEQEQVPEYSSLDNSEVGRTGAVASK